MPKKIEISHRTIIFTVVFLLSLWFLVQIADILFWLFVSFILMAAFKPTVDYLEGKKFPRVLAILLIYTILLFAVSFVVSTIVPPLISQTITLIERLPGYLRSVLPFVTINPAVVSQQIAPLGQNLVRLSLGIFSNVIALFTIIVITFYLLLERKNLNSYLTFLLGERAGNNVVTVINKVEERLGAWVRGQLTLIFAIGILTYIGLVILGIPYALPLAILAAMLEIVPNIGPVLSAIPAVIVAFAVSSLHPLFTIIMYIIIQQLENQVIVPIVMRRMVGLPPLVTIVAILIGVKLAGVRGAIMAVPVVVTFEAIFTEYFRLKEVS
ncbi:hypothetical protein A3J20_03910 [Candidatus Gottesmanbacteria bacterium RIFCSPLOWO2_02_FULL_42_29]|uniref:AI-2E family transporter n=2 Tax=Candidatus Gottesmaniibacteriota TaxID=1752720 RepID=A0A1F6BGW8_9BACT|nr:MAG: hypothetical protein A2781_03260 [Candidatus Gottesmanbacteria bacterium RIFCSPHIGHO2_01_FULL_42_27]OGG20056.1 MAG: hypothetical protein A3E72_02015 [Candidatus Gottesmanbacteria bacterium RIFCSPHIGHO2_12_FULL_43_26]OGG33761.1 MAG: hypothetical protein A3G68_02810 [Candidatus Gottesmanbacteria bacterium RIFCSPLOWO2_12_FULL_42_10]OGG36175.1 MAG: hypothetical protein A2968_05690 [Candidatus Gottesmanbacteria bacterium RIFCSPLOWO2_01_FULL_42_22]OGG38261.1 MAG: hypothetical protein A3J20_03